jgi:quercetin dioxygenase-like cupin family protein
MSFVKFESLEVKEPVPGFKANFVHSKNMTLVYWKIKEGAVMPEHSHPHEQVASVVEGRFELTVAGESRVLDIDYAAVIPSNTAHSGRAITDCRIIDAFHPVREDYQ